jgi:hypothetical protein
VRGVFVDANGSLADIFERQNKAGDPAVRINRDADIRPDQIPALLDGAEIVIIDHTPLPTEIARRCNGLKHVVFLGTGARSYMNPEELAELGIEVHLIKGYGDTAVAECAIALMWAAARGIARMDREMRAGNWLREDGMQLTGKTLGLIGIGRVGSRPVLIAAVIASMIGVSMTLLHSMPLILAGLVLCSSGVFVCQSAATSYIQIASPPGGRASAAGLYVACYYAGGSVSGVLPGFFWRFGGWTACVALVLVVQATTIVVAAFGWRES